VSVGSSLKITRGDRLTGDPRIPQFKFRSFKGRSIAHPWDAHSSCLIAYTHEEQGPPLGSFIGRGVIRTTMQRVEVVRTVGTRFIDDDHKFFPSTHDLRRKLSAARSRAVRAVSSRSSIFVYSRVFPLSATNNIFPYYTRNQQLLL